MDFINDLYSRLVETKKFVDLLQSQHDQLTNGSYIFMGNEDDVRANNWTMNCFRLIQTTKEIQKQLLDKCLMTDGQLTILEEHLNAIQPICDLLGVIWLNMRKQLLSMANHNFTRSDNYHRLKDEIDKRLGDLVRQTFFVIQQPPQVVKTNAKFHAVVRSLAGSLFTLAPNELLKIHACILNEQQTREAVTQYSSPYSCPSTSYILTTSGAIMNREAVLLRTSTGNFQAKFQNMLLKKISRTEKKGLLSVMDEKFAIAFTAAVKCADGQLDFFIQAVSSPLVVIVHGSQETNAWATIIWDNAFAPPLRLPFAVPDKVPWVNVGQMLSNKFAESCGCHLVPDDLHFLATKAFRDATLTAFDSMYLSWSKFAKEPLPGLIFTFWEWFYSILKLTREHLKDFWAPGNRLICGFINRSDCEKQLIGKPDGTFLLRFSETALGCLSIAYTVTNRFNQQVVLNLAPFSFRDLSIRSLADRINDLKDLRFLCPNIPKDEAFGAFYGPVEESELVLSGYVKSVLVTQVPRWTTETDFFTNKSNLSNCNQSVSSISDIQLQQNPPSLSGISTSNDNPSSLQSIENLMDNDLDRMVNDVNFNFDDLNFQSNQALNSELTEFIGNFNGFNYNF